MVVRRSAGQRCESANGDVCQWLPAVPPSDRAARVHCLVHLCYGASQSAAESHSA